MINSHFLIVLKILLKLISVSVLLLFLFYKKIILLLIILLRQEVWMKIARYWEMKQQLFEILGLNFKSCFKCLQEFCRNLRKIQFDFDKTEFEFLSLPIISWLDLRSFDIVRFEKFYIMNFMRNWVINSLCVSMR